MVSADEVTSSKQNDTKISKFGWVIFILQYILQGNVELSVFLLSAKAKVKLVDIYANHSCVG